MTDSANKNGGLFKVLQNRYFRRLVAGQVVSSLGDWAATFALIALIFEKTHNAAAVGVVLVLRLLPPLLAAPIGGVLADRYPRRTLMLITSTLQGILIASIPFLPVILIYVVALVQEGLGLIFVSARDAATPDLIPAEQLETANGFVLGSSYGAIPLGAVLFSGLQLVAVRIVNQFHGLHAVFSDPLTGVFFFDALTFFFAVYMISRIRIKTVSHRLDLKFGSGLVEGFHYMRKTKKLRALSNGVIVATLGGGILFSVGIGYVHGTLGANNTSFGWLATTWGLGMFGGVFVSQKLQSTLGRDKENIFVWSLCASAIALSAMALLPYLNLAYILAVPFGASLALSVILAITLAQQLASPSVRGRIMAGLQMMIRLGLSIGALAIGAFAAAIPQVHIGIKLDGNQQSLLIGAILIAAGAYAAHRGFMAAD